MRGPTVNGTSPRQSAGLLGRVKQGLPWWARVGAKIVLARLPVRYGAWKSLGVFEHGAMNQTDYVIAVFRRHLDAARLATGFVSLELGPGDSLASMLVARAHGGSAMYLVDAGDFASRDLAVYAAVAQRLAETGTPVAVPLDSVARMMHACKAEYVTGGLMSLRSIPSASVDHVWSQAVLEHVPRGEFLETLVELRRVLRQDGVATHQVDLRDHLGGALNSLRFTDAVWEGRFMARSGFYTNRIRFVEMLDLFEQAGFAAEVLQRDEWPAVPTPRQCMSERFRWLPDDDLRVSSFFVRLRPR
jgi:SAM-dependent methyltransferase